MDLQKWFNRKTTLKWVFGVIIGVLITIYINTYFSPNAEDKTPQLIREIISFFCGISSLGGILLTLLQTLNTHIEVDQVKLIADNTHKAVEETKSSIKRIFNITHVTKYCEQLRLIQEYIQLGEWKLVLHIAQELKEIIMELRSYLESSNQDSFHDQLSAHIKALGINIGHISKGLSSNLTNIKKDGIMKDFEALHTTMLEIKNTLTN